MSYFWSFVVLHPVQEPYIREGYLPVVGRELRLYSFSPSRLQLSLHPYLVGPGRSSDMGSRYYFHLVDSQNVLRDDFGAVASDLAEAYVAAANIIEEFHRSQEDSVAEWRDWHLIVMDDSEDFALIIPICKEPLDRP